MQFDHRSRNTLHETDRPIDGPGEVERAVSATTGLTVVTVHTSAGHQAVSVTDRGLIVREFPDTVLINSYGSDGLLLGIASSPRKVWSQLLSLKAEERLVFCMKDVCGRDPFAYFNGWTTVPRVDRSGLYQLIVKFNPGDGGRLEDLLGSFNVTKAVQDEGRMILQVPHVLEFIAYSDSLRQEDGLSLERPHTWQLQPRICQERSEANVSRERLFWVRVEDDQFKSLSVAQKQYSLLQRLRVLGGVRQLEHQFLGVNDNYLAVFSGLLTLSGADSDAGLVLLELPPDGLPHLYVPTVKMEDNGFFSVSGKFPGNISDDLKQEFANEMKKFGAVGFSGDNSEFKLHYVNSRSAERASLSTIAQSSNFNLKLNSSVLNFTPKPNMEKKPSKMIPAVLRSADHSRASPRTRASVAKAETVGEKVEEEVVPDEASSGGTAEAGPDSASESSASFLGEMTETELLTINWQQGKTLPSALKSLAKFLVSVTIVEVVEQEKTKEIVFRFNERKKLIKMLKIYSNNQTNSFEKLRSSTPRLEFSASEENNNSFGLLVTKKKTDKEFNKRLKAKFPGVEIEEKPQFTTFWFPSKLEYYRALTDKSFNVHFVPSVDNYSEVKYKTGDTETLKNPVDDVSEVLSDDGPTDVNENDINIKSVEDIKLQEKIVFGFVWKHLEGFKVKDEQIISRQLSEFIKTVKCSKITSDEDGFVFHFSSQEDVDAMLLKHSPHLVGDQQKLESLTRKFTLIPSRGSYGVFSVSPINPKDFEHFTEGKHYFNSLWFSDKMDLVRVLRDETISSLYPTLYIDCRNIMVLQSIRPQLPHSPFKLSPVNLNLLSPNSKPAIIAGFGRNVSFSYSQVDGRPVRLTGSRSTGSQSSLGGGHQLDASLGTKMRRVELYLREKRGEGELVLSLSKPRQKVEEAKDEDSRRDEPLTVDLLRNQTLFIPYEAEKDAVLSAKLVEDVSWFECPVSVLPGVLSSSGQSILQIKMRNKEVAIAAYLGLKLKYPDLQIDKSGALVDMKPDEETGLYTLLFKDKNRKRYAGTLAKFSQFSSQPGVPPVVSRGDGDDVILVGYRTKADALRALRAVREDQEFPELCVSPGSKV